MSDNLFEVLAEPKRRTILDALRVKERTVGELVALTSLSQPGVSKHLRILREAGLVSAAKHGQKHLYRLHAQPLTDVDRWLQPYRPLWPDKLDALERYLDEEES
ncbi:ArsR/SmtB family transcription factor [Cohnella nanjingensis]|uniref:Winged helix-turn-helix transcriptional regulator n=1 Tax=Cohnella nanjingensis TaxID=1387779 RepID=A0A7X0VFB6_9BACL|nr:metalloregulator ArsR/SmtB family transcription factor [Cohnella nanjingensis]MBB6670434.1 winged helix-turn-helix transcriptional regulator [Cohnella nanjingensis]